MAVPRTLIKSIKLVLILNLASCASVNPWERGVLAKPHMALDISPMQNTLRAHAYNSREAAAGGDSANGGGCGCY